MTLLASLEDFASSRGVSYDPTDLQALIALEGASGVVRAYTNQDFGYAEDDEVILDGHGTRALLLPQLPVHEVSEVATIAWDLSETILETTEYRLDPAAGILYREWSTAAWPAYGAWWHGDGHRNIRVVYSHGYILPGEPEVTDIGPLPAELSLVTMQIAARMFTMAQQGGQMVTAETVGSYSVTYGGGSDSSSVSQGPVDTERLILDKYRVRSFA